MTASSRAELSPLQWRLLRAFFAVERSFFLTGGAALAGFHLGHRTTDDLDLFTLDAVAFERVRYQLEAAAGSFGARVAILRDHPGYKRFAVSAGDDTVVVDTVLERAVQLHAEKEEYDGILIDPRDEILANKLTALVGRMEERDLVDVLCLERAGLRVEDALAPALAKDGGATAATLAWLLSEVRIPDDATLPAGVTPEQLRAFVLDLVVRFRRAALPATTGP